MKRLLALLLCLVMALSLIPAAAAEDVEIVDIEESEETIPVVETEPENAPVPNGDVAINETNFPDAKFRSYVSSKFDSNGDGMFSASEIAAVTSIDVHRSNISTLTGVEFFTALKYLNCDENSLSSLDVSGCVALETLYCENCALTYLNVSGCTELKYLDCEINPLPALDVSCNTSLVRLWCARNRLTSLDLSHNTALEALFCYKNFDLKALDVSGCTSLSNLNCCSTVIDQLNICTCPVLVDAYCYGTKKEDTLDGVAYWIYQYSGNYLQISPSTTVIVDADKPTITTQPKSQSASEGATLLFMVTASGDHLSYQWQFREGSSGDWADSDITGSQTATLTVEATAARNGYQFRCIVTNYAGSVTSSAATLTVIVAAKPTITTQPKSQSAAVDTTVKFKVVATGAETYQWYYRTSSSGSWAKSSLSGNKTATLSVKATEARNGYQYRCKVSNSAGYKYSSAATLTIVTKPTISTQPKSQSAKEGETVKFTVAATGGSLKYQWYYRTSSSGEWKKSTGTGATTKTLSVEAKAYRDGYQYRCRVSNAAGYKYSSAATLTVLTKPAITTQPSSKTVSAGTTVKFTVKATGGDLSYQWQYRTSSSGEWKNCTGTGATTATLTVEAKSFRSGYQYRCRVSNAVGYKYSSAATLTVK